MREGWDLVKLGSLCDIQNGFAFDSKLFNNDGKGLPLIRIRDIKRGYSETFTTEECDNAYVVKDGDYLIGMDGEFNIGQWKSENALLNQRVCKLLPSSKILPRFIYYYIPKALKDIEDKTAYATVKHLSSKQIKEIHIPNISLPEQQRIVDILDREFAKIDALKANAEKSLQAAKDLFQATTDTMLGNEKWRELTIGEIAKIKGGKRVPKGYKLEKEPTAHRYIRVADFTDQGTIRPESVLYISDEVYKTIKAYTISSKDVYISIAGTIGKSGIIPDTLDGANLTENACKLVLGPDFYNRFVFFATKTSSFKKQVETLTMQAAQPKLALTRLATIRVRVPSSIQEQETIVERLDGIADTIAILQDNYQKTLALCDDLKQALLRKAFNGEL